MRQISLQRKTVLITGAARRVGATVARRLHEAGMNLVLHYRSSGEAAEALRRELEAKRPDSAATLHGDLAHTHQLKRLVEAAEACWGRLDVVVNNASTFKPTPVGTVTEQIWDELLASNLKAPFFIAQAAAPMLKRRHGTIVNIVDIHAERALKDYPVYSIAKAGLTAMTRAMAKELAPEVRVNGVAPGAILWPDRKMDPSRQREILARIPLGRLGGPEAIAKTVLYLVEDADYVTGQVIAVDGGRTLNI